MFNPFVVFDLPVQFNIDFNELEQRYIDLMRLYHPDRLLSLPSKEKREVMQKSTEINDAYNELKDDILRAQAIINLAVADPSTDFDGKILTQDNDFIIEQFALRSKVDEIKQNFDFDAYAEVDEACKRLRHENMQIIHDAFGAKDYRLAQKIVYRLQFIRKLASELSDLEM